MYDLCVIPARLGSSRFPNKPMKEILGIPMLGHIVHRCKLKPIFDQVVVATCDDEIAEYCHTIDVPAIMTSSEHERATDRVYEATTKLEYEFNTRFDTVTLVQGDEPLVTPAMLSASLHGLKESGAPITNLKCKIQSRDDFLSPNCVKVITNLAGNAIYFSRAPIPCAAKNTFDLPVTYKQVPIISMTRSFVNTYSELTPTYHEELESIDMNRVIDHGYPLFCIETDVDTVAVDVPEDLVIAETRMRRCPLFKLYS